METSVSVIIPVHNGKVDTLQCLKSLRLQRFLNTPEIILVDNASHDGTSDIVKNKFPKVKIISLSRNLGFAGGVNEGIKIAKGNYLFVINNDIIFNKHFLQQLITAMEMDEKIGIVGGKIYYQSPKDKILFCGVHFNAWTGTIQKLPRPNKTKQSAWIQGCAMLIKKNVIEKIGLFDPEYFHSFEDADLCLRAKRAGFTIMYYPKAVAWHKEGSTIDTFGPRKKANELYKAKFRYIFKNCTPLQIISTSIFQFLIIAPIRKFVIKKPYFSFSEMVDGYIYNIKLIRDILKIRNNYEDSVIN